MRQILIFTFLILSACGEEFPDKYDGKIECAFESESDGLYLIQNYDSRFSKKVKVESFEQGYQVAEKLNCKVKK